MVVRQMRGCGGVVVGSLFQVVFGISVVYVFGRFYWICCARHWVMVCMANFKYCGFFNLSSIDLSCEMIASMVASR